MNTGSARQKDAIPVLPTARRLRKMSKDVPAMAFIEQQVLAQAASDGRLRSPARRVETMYGLETGYLGNGLFWQTRVLSLLYALVLFPKEYWSLEKGDPIYGEIEQRWSLGGIEIITQDEYYGNTIYGFIHRLRNAVSHAHIAFKGDDIEFSDIWKGQEVYRARISKDEVENFLRTVGSIMANRRNPAVH